MGHPRATMLALVPMLWPWCYVTVLDFLIGPGAKLGVQQDN